VSKFSHWSLTVGSETSHKPGHLPWRAHFTIVSGHQLWRSGIQKCIQSAGKLLDAWILPTFSTQNTTMSHLKLSTFHQTSHLHKTINQHTALQNFFTGTIHMLLKYILLHFCFLFNHLTYPLWCPSLEKGIIEGTLPGNRKRGRPKTAWIDNVTSRTGLKLEDIIRKVDNRSARRTTICSAANPRTEHG